MILQFLVSFGFQTERKDWVPSCRVYQPCLLNDITFNKFALSQLQLQLLSIFIVCLQFFTDKEPDCTWQGFADPSNVQESLEKYPRVWMWVWICKCVFLFCSVTFSLPQDSKCEGTKAWDDPTCHKTRHEASVCQMTLPDNWNRVKISINTGTRAQLLHHNSVCCPSSLLFVRLEHPLSLSFSHGF